MCGSKFLGVVQVFHLYIIITVLCQSCYHRGRREGLKIPLSTTSPSFEDLIWPFELSTIILVFEPSVFQSVKVGIWAVKVMRNDVILFDNVEMLMDRCLFDAYGTRWTSILIFFSFSPVRVTLQSVLSFFLATRIFRPSPRGCTCATRSARTFSSTCWEFKVLALWRSVDFCSEMATGGAGEELRR